MAFQPADFCAEAVAKFATAASPFYNVFHFYKAGGYDSSALIALGAIVDDAVSDFKDVFMSEGAAYVETTVRGLEEENDILVTNQTHAGAGGVAQPGCPASAAICITHYSFLTGKSARGRTYFGGFSRTDVLTPGEWVHVTVDGCVDFCNGLRVAAAADGWTFVVLSRWSGGVKRAKGIPFTIAASVARNYFIDHQDGRLRSGH